MGKFGVTELLVILAIVVLLFGTRKLRGTGGDIGGAIKNFRKALKDEDKTASTDTTSVIEDKDKV